MSERAYQVPAGAVAIVGMAGRFPGAGDVDELWDVLRNGVESIRDLSPEELERAGVARELREDPGYVPRSASLDDPGRFDASFFGYLPRAAEVMDPQHRHFLECAWQALEDAAIDPSRHPGRVGVFGGVARNTYLLEALKRDPGLLDELGDHEALIGGEKDFPATRVAYQLDLRGPCINVQTACSTSGVAVHLACQSLLSGECDTALAGGGRVHVPGDAGYLYEEGGILSPDGRCRAFDADAAGTIRGSGMAFVVLRRLEDALRDGDPVRAVIRGTAANNDGSEKVGFTAPGVRGQADVVSEALAVSGVSADSVSYVEAHGTGTSLGDPIEVAALTRAFRQSTDRTGYCAIGSLKTNIGHLDAGAAVAGIIKCVLSMEHGLLPPSLNFRRPNPEIAFDTSPFYVNAELAEWEAEDGPRRAGISSFGLGGTNFHAVLEEAPSEAAPWRDPSGEAEGAGAKADTAEGGPHLLLLSARSREALDTMGPRLARYLERRPGLSLRDVAHTLRAGRMPMEHRRTLVCRDREEALTLLEESHQGIRGRTSDGRPPEVVFLYPGSGAQHPDMGLGLYRTEPVYRRAFDRCLELLDDEARPDIRELVLGGNGRTLEERAERLELPTRTMPALFATEHALTRLLLDRGVAPGCVAGHSTGQYAAGVTAGVWSLEAGMKLVLCRARLFENLPEGRMASVALPPEEVEELGVDGLSVAVVNRSGSCVVSGPRTAVGELGRILEERNVEVRPLHVTVAGHSRMVDGILDDFRREVESVELRAPEIPIMSDRTGRWLEDGQATDPDYWVGHLRHTLRWDRALDTLLERSRRIFVQVGPGNTLAGFLKLHPAREPEQAVFTGMRHPRDEPDDVTPWLRLQGGLWTCGVEVGWSAPCTPPGRRIPLPPYPFQGDRHWLQALERAPAARRDGDGAGPGPDPDRTRTDTTQEDTIEQVARPAAGNAESRQERILRELRTIFSGLSGLDPDGMDPETTFLEMGFDSLVLTQVSMKLKRELGAEVGLRTLIEGHPTLAALSSHLDRVLPADVLSAPEPEPDPVPAEAGPAPTGPVPAGSPPGRAADTGALERVLARQLEVMTEQLALLREGAAAVEGDREDPRASRDEAKVREPVSAPATASTVDGGSDSADEERHGPWRQPGQATDGHLTPRQREHLGALTRRLTERMEGSRRLTQEHREHLADPRTVEGFRKTWKELVHPVVAEEVRGARIRDVDGNEFVDVAMGFGVALLGHAPDPVRKAIREQLDRSMSIGPQTPLAGEVAELISRMTGMERVAFANTGSEAVLAATRMARTVTGRKRIAFFRGSYHGIFDEVLARGIDLGDGRKSLPVAPGIPEKAVEDVLLLDYGDPASLETLRAHAGEVAAVLVEPVQSRHPDRQPRDFVRDLRTLTREEGIALVFDEMITGFRSHPGGIQALWNVRADLATYGKVVGGGMPIGVVTGSSEYMDALDGGHWRFGDDSGPEAGVTWFAGTFVRHPLSLASARAVLTHLEERGPGLQEALNARTTRFVEELNRYYDGIGVPIRVEHFSSFFLVRFLSHKQHESLFYFHLRDQGVHITEGRAAFLSTAHTEEDLALLLRAFKESARALQEGGFLPGELDAGVERDAEGVPESAGLEVQELPLTQGQEEIWLSARSGGDASCAFNLSNRLRLRGSLDSTALRDAADRLVERHQALRTDVDPEEPIQRIHPEGRGMPFAEEDLADLEPEARDARLEELRRDAVETPFDLREPPLARMRLIRLGAEEHELHLTAHHIVADGWSCGTLVSELGELYSALVEGREPELSEPTGLSEYVRERIDRKGEAEEARRFWLERLGTDPPSLELPPDRSRTRDRGHDARRVDLPLDRDLHARVQTLAKERNATVFAVLLSTFQLLALRLTGQEDMVVGISSADQAMLGHPELVGHCVRVLPFRSTVRAEVPFVDHLREVRGLLLDAFEHHDTTFGSVLKELPIRREAGRVPLVSVLFNVDPTLEGVAFSGLEADTRSNPRSKEIFDLFFNVVVSPGDFRVECTFSSALFDPGTVEGWLDRYAMLLEAVIREPEKVMGEIRLGGEDPGPRPALRATKRSPRGNGSGPGAMPPSGETEKVLAGIWEELLGRDGIGTREDFFELGGHSLMATRLLRRVEERFNVEIVLPAFFDEPTIAGLATLVEVALASEGEAESPQEGELEEMTI